MPSNTTTPTFRKSKRVSTSTKRRNTICGGGEIGCKEKTKNIEAQALSFALGERTKDGWWHTRW